MDLTFILLITFIITFPLIEQGVPVNLPKAKGAELAPDRSTTITVDRQGNLFLDNSPISTEGLEQRMQSLGAGDSDVNVFVRADEGLAYGRVVQVLKILHGAKVTKMALVTQSEE